MTKAVVTPTGPVPLDLGRRVLARRRARKGRAAGKRGSRDGVRGIVAAYQQIRYFGGKAGRAWTWVATTLVGGFDGVTKAMLAPQRWSRWFSLRWRGG